MMQEEYLIQETGQLKAVSNPVRTQMLQLLIERQLTATQLGESMNIAPARAHYHLKQLEQAGLVQLVETRENAGILEKYYRAVSKLFRLDRTFTHDPHGIKARQSELHAVIESTARNFEQSMDERDEAPGPESDLLFQVLSLSLAPQRYERMLSRLRALLLEFEGEDRSERPGTNRYTLMLMAYPEPAAKTAANTNGNGRH